MQEVTDMVVQSDPIDIKSEGVASVTMKTVGPLSRNKLDGVSYDFKSGQYLSFIKMRKTGKNHRIGLFYTEEQAAVAHDMQAFQFYGLLADEMLNFPYQYEEDLSEGASSRNLKLRLSGVTVTIECIKDNEQDSTNIKLEKPVEPNSVVTAEVAPEVVVEAEAVDSLICSPPGTSAVLPGKADVNRRWPERLTTSFFPTAAFAYEVTFTHQSSLGLQLRPLMLTYSVAGGKRTLGCCVVIDSSQSPSPLVQAGDILVSVNEMSLIGSHPLTNFDQRDVPGGFSFDASVKAISQAKAPRTIRFLRTAGLSVNQQLSPAEASLLVSDHHPIAKYTVEHSSLPGATPHQVMQYLDNQVPLTVRRMLQGQRIVWETNLLAGQNPPTSMNTPTLHNAFLQETEAAGAGGGVGGIYKDRYRWLAVLHVPLPGNRGRHYLLGKFESEEEANAAYKWALEEVRLTGSFSCRRKKRLSIMLDGSAVTLTGSLSSASLQAAAATAAATSAAATGPSSALPLSSPAVTPAVQQVSDAKG